ncbi:MAG: hypothetical protein ACYDAE_19055 [Steroidobacteraceae bacterium]
MKASRHVSLSLGVALLLGALAAYAQVSPSSSAAPPGGVPLDSLITTVARNTGMRFVLDPRVRAEVTLVGEDPSSVTYDELLTILNTYGFVAVKTGGYVVVTPDADTRSEPLPFVSGNEKLPDDEAVTAVIHVRSLPAGWLVPILRPLVPQWGHLAAMPCSNDLVIVERFASVRRMETIIKAMDTGAPIKPPSCIVPMPLPCQSPRPLPSAPAAPHHRAP